MLDTSDQSTCNTFSTLQIQDVYLRAILSTDESLMFMQQLENSVRKELLHRCREIRLVVEDNEIQKPPLNVELRRSVSVACAGSVVELKIKAPTWVGQVHHLTRFLLHDTLTSA